VKNHRFYVIAISAVAALGCFLFGFDSGVINGTVDALNRAFHTSTSFAAQRRAKVAHAEVQCRWPLCWKVVPLALVDQRVTRQGYNPASGDHSPEHRER
jgi:hypothetical protein